MGPKGHEKLQKEKGKGQKATKKYKKEKGSDHRDSLTVICAAALVKFVFDCFAWFEKECGSETEVSSKHVYCHGAASINSTEHANADNSVKCIENDF